MAVSAVDISLPKLGRCLRVQNAPDAVQALAQVLPGWPLTVHPAQGATPETYIYRDNDEIGRASCRERV